MQSLSHVSDFLDRNGALALARNIRNFWHLRGHTNVRVDVVPTGDKEETWSVRTNLINGMPPRK